MTMEEENDIIAQGESPPVLFTDNHVEHILSVARLLSSPADRGNPALVQAAAQHVGEHLAQLRSMDPDLRAILLGSNAGPPPTSPPPPQGQEGPAAGVQEPPPPNEPMEQ